MGDQQEKRGEKMGFNATWSMAVGGMVGGGIFSVLGVVILASGRWAWLAFVLAGLIAMASGYSYAKLAEIFGEGGGAFTFLREMDHEGFAGSLSWVLVTGYVLTISVYAFTFGHYLSHAFGLPAWVPRITSLAVIAVLTWVNLRGVGESSALEIVTVWGKLLVLVALAAFGLWRWEPAQLSAGVEARGMGAAIVGAAAVFMAYEGFQLLTYDYDDIENPSRTLPRAILSGVGVVIVVYVVVAVGAAMLVGAGTLVEEKEVALAVAGRTALGVWGMGLVTVAAAFSTASAINATLFATARLMEDLAARGELPGILEHENRAGVPDHAVLAIGVGGGVLAMAGTLETLVSGASLIFLFTFATVNVLAFREGVDRRWISALGCAGAAAAGVVSVVRLAKHEPLALVFLTVIVLLALIVRPWLLCRSDR